jgi:membrane protein DedA with SNARE-associated domain
MLDYLEGLIEQVDPMVAYLILCVSAFVENTFPPIPGDTVTVIGAYLITTGKLSFTGVWLSTTLGSVLGFMTMYYIGLRFGRKFFDNEKRAKIFGAKNIEKTKIWFANWGYWVIGANRFLSGTRSVISIFAGMVGLGWLNVLILSTLSALIWNGLLMWAGYYLGVNWDSITELISRYNTVVIALTVIAIITFILYKFLNKKKKQENATG